MSGSDQVRVSVTGALLTLPAQVDSIAWNPHKMVGAPLQTSAFIVKHRGLLHTSNSANATYLFQQVKYFMHLHILRPLE